MNTIKISNNRIGRAITAQDGEFIGREELRAFAPSIFNDRYYSGLSERYGHINTGILLDAFANEGFQPVMVARAIPRKEEKVPHAKHMLRLRSFSQQYADGEGHHEVVLLNSSDGSCAVKLYAGYFRMVCNNGLISGEFDGGTIRHTLNAQRMVDAALEAIFERIRIQANVMAAFRARTVSWNEAEWLASEAIRLRWPDMPTMPVTPARLLASRREEDNGFSLWQVTNVIQENVLRGGVAVSPLYRAERKRAAKQTRPVNGLHGQLAINVGLWKAAESLLDKAGPTQGEGDKEVASNVIPFPIAA